MNTLRKDGFFIFVIGCTVIGFAIWYCVHTFTNKKSMGVGAPPEQRGFVIDIAGQTASSFAVDLAEMRDVHATAVLFVSSPAESALPEVISNATSLNLVSWLAIPPSEKPEEYRAAAEAGAKFCTEHSVGYLVVGMRASSSLGDDAYWNSLIASLHKTSPSVQIIFVSDYEDYIFRECWNDSDIIGVSGKFPAPAKPVEDPDKLRAIFENSWASSVHDMVAFAMRDWPNARPKTAAVIDATIPKGYTPAAEEFYLRGLLHQSKRQPPKEKTESAAAGRDPLSALFLSGWRTELKSLRAVIKSEWDETAITYTATAPAETAPADDEPVTTNP